MTHRHSGEIPEGAARLLGRDDAPLTPHRQPVIQCYQDLHNRSGVAGAFGPWQQLQGMQLEPDGIDLN